MLPSLINTSFIYMKAVYSPCSLPTVVSNQVSSSHLVLSLLIFHLISFSIFWAFLPLLNRIPVDRKQGRAQVLSWSQIVDIAVRLFLPLVSFIYSVLFLPFNHILLMM